MKLILYVFGILLFTACTSIPGNNQETDQFDKRITLLEQRIDSLLRTRKTDSAAENFSGNVLQDARCLALTKKGTQCKRKARNNSFCWQHGG